MTPCVCAGVARRPAAGRLPPRGPRPGGRQPRAGAGRRHRHHLAHRRHVRTLRHRHRCGQR